jgi:hypothetical protein
LEAIVSTTGLNAKAASYRPMPTPGNTARENSRAASPENEQEVPMNSAIAVPLNNFRHTSGHAHRLSAARYRVIQTYDNPVGRATLSQVLGRVPVGRKPQSTVLSTGDATPGAQIWVARPYGPRYDVGEDKANMAKRLDVSPDLPLSPEALAELRQRYAMLSTPSLQEVYADAWERCKLDRNGRPPRAQQIQVLVTAWKMLRRNC